ncbi:uncharacterized protein N7482_010082 [Penicillium canariense]|uniref:Uncharacterized protein n=1 Tax=Penicillium canariense TaxID=189055 RepID=A0A9W9LE59_9EURO|nr:uncharacterized protein N7482_010082 [Penicillium canariense]KAJ5150830.1 hypothetical protein N7482_010082 [Penicillium canariense]
MTGKGAMMLPLAGRIDFLNGSRVNFADAVISTPHTPFVRINRDQKPEACRTPVNIAGTVILVDSDASSVILLIRPVANVYEEENPVQAIGMSIGYYDPPKVKVDSTKDGSIPSIQMIYEPSQVWNHHVIPLVLDKFSVSIVDTSIDSIMFATIPRIISCTPEGSPVYAVCDAIACAYLASTTGSAAAIAHRTQAYGAALRIVNAALDDPAQCKNDSTLLAIWMFVVYEFLSNPHLTSVAGSEEGERHCRGLAALINLRNSEQFSRQDGRNLVCKPKH